MHRYKSGLGLGWVMAGLAQNSAWGCPACFQQTDNVGLGTGLTVGLCILMGFTFLLLGGIFAAVYHIEKKRKADELPRSSAGPATLR